MFKNVASVGEVIENLSVCMITCWYHNISMANYSENLIKALARREVSVKVVTSHCVCKKNYRGSSALFDGEYCLVTTPFDSYADVAFRAKLRGLVRRSASISDFESTRSRRRLLDRKGEASVRISRRRADIIPKPLVV